MHAIHFLCLLSSFIFSGRFPFPPQSSFPAPPTSSAASPCGPTLRMPGSSIRICRTLTGLILPSYPVSSRKHEFRELPGKVPLVGLNRCCLTPMRGRAPAARVPFSLLSLKSAGSPWMHLSGQKKRPPHLMAHSYLFTCSYGTCHLLCVMLFICLSFFT